MKNQLKLKKGITASSGMKFLVKPVYSILTSLILFSFGCQKTNFDEMSDDPMDMRLHNSETSQINLVGDNSEYSPAFIDAGLVNAWGLAFSDEGSIWISGAETGMSGVYDQDGMTLMPSVTIPGVDGETGHPTGVLYNHTGTFMIPSTGEKSEFIFATENGTIAAWASGTSAITVADRSENGSVYKGITMARTMAGNWYIFATDFHNARIDVFDADFNLVDGFPFSDPDMPAGFAPFNIKEIDGMLYVTYAKQLAPENVDDEKGDGNGYINKFSTYGVFVERFASNGSLNSPWGIAKKPGFQGAILVANFGSGRISVFSALGNKKSILQLAEGVPVDIQGIWAIEFADESIEGDAHQRLYFTAGPDHEEHGLFGYLDPVLE